jgi:hypothetical protein
MSFGPRTAAVSAAVLLCAAGTARASGDTMFKANVPFAFEVNGHTLPAGTYLIQHDDMSSPSVLTLRHVGKDHAIATVTTIPDNGQDPAGSKPALAFKRHEGEYQLSTVWQSSGDGFDISNR